jgi:hypothetical protein
MLFVGKNMKRGRKCKRKKKKRERTRASAWEVK